MKTRDLGFLLLGLLVYWFWLSGGKHRAQGGVEVRRESSTGSSTASTRLQGGAPLTARNVGDSGSTQIEVRHSTLNSSFTRVAQQSEAVEISSSQKGADSRVELRPVAATLVPAVGSVPVRDGTEPAKPAKQRTRFSARSGSTLIMDGTANMIQTRWRVQSDIIAGRLDAAPDFPGGPTPASIPARIDAEAEVSIPVNSLKSIDNDGKHFSDAMDNVMYEKLRGDKYKRIVYRLTDLVLTEPTKRGNVAYRLKASGELVVAGVTNAVSMPITVLRVAGQKLKISGATTVKMTSFGIQPPSAMAGALNVGDNLRLSFDWLVSSAANAPGTRVPQSSPGDEN